MGFKTIEYVTNNPDVVLYETIPKDVEPTYKVGTKYHTPEGDVIILNVHETTEPQNAKKTIWLNKDTK